MFFILSHAWDKENSESYSIYKHDAVNIADPSSKQDACHALRLWLSVGHWTPESEGIRFNSTLGFRIFSLSHACDRQKTSFPIFFTELKPYHLSYSMKEICSYELRNNESGSEKFAFF